MDESIEHEVEPQHERGFRTRRRLLGASAAGALMTLVDPAIRAGAWAQGSDAPEKKEVKVGFIPLTDCASVVVASVMEFDKKYGIKIVPSKEASWAAVRDKLVNGELDAAHVLYGLIYGVQMGIGGPKKDMAILMNLNHNGQAITLSNQLKDKGATDGAKLKALIDKEKREYTFAQTFPTGTHAMWIYYWLAAQRHPSVQRREDDRRAAAADGRQHARRQHGRLLRRRAVEQPRDLRQDRLHRRDDAGRVEGPSREDARHHARIRAEESEHRARDDRRRARCVEVHRRHGQPQEGVRDHRRQVVRQLPGRRSSTSASKATTTTGSASSGRIPTT